MSPSWRPQSVLITGATGGIGSELAEAYAAPGMTLVLSGRNEERLTKVAVACTVKGARVISKTLDLCDRSALMAWLAEVSERERVELVIANAGVNTNVGADRAGEPWEAVETLLNVNVMATMATVHATLPALRRRDRGQIALISSLAAYYGLPLTPSYCASKAAIKTYGEALRGGLAAHNIWVNVVMPGYVESQMCREMPGPKPFLWPADKAARLIKQELAANKSRISFPFPLNWGCWWLSVLPSAISERILRRLNYGG